MLYFYKLILYLSELSWSFRVLEKLKLWMEQEWSERDVSICPFQNENCSKIVVTLKQIFYSYLYLKIR